MLNVLNVEKMILIFKDMLLFKNTDYPLKITTLCSSSKTVLVRFVGETIPETNHCLSITTIPAVPDLDRVANAFADFFALFVTQLRVY